MRRSRRAEKRAVRGIATERSESVEGAKPPERFCEVGGAISPNVLPGSQPDSPGSGAITEKERKVRYAESCERIRPQGGGEF